MRDSLRLQFGVYDAALRELTIANAGGTLPLLVHNGEVTEVNVGGMPLGLLPEAEYDEVTLSLSPGDMVIFASDGIHESMNKEQEEFGVDRLKALLSTVMPNDPGFKVAQRIVKATDEHTGPAACRTTTARSSSPRHRRLRSDFSKLPIIY